MSSAISRGPRKSCSVRLMGPPCPVLEALRAWLALLAQRGGDVSVGAAIAGLALPPGNQHLCRAALGGIGVEALTLLVALALAERVGGRLAIRRAVGGEHADRPPRHHRTRLQPRQRVACSLGSVFGGLLRACIEIAERLARALHGRHDPVDQLAHLMDQTGLFRRSLRRGLVWWWR